MITNLFLPGFTPEVNIPDGWKFDAGIIDLRQFDKIIISLSGGKDSHAMLFYVRDLALKQGVGLDKLIALWADTGMEWHSTANHVATLTAKAGIELRQVKPFRDFFEGVQYRWELLMRNGHPNLSPFPSKSCRYCTSDMKTHAMDKTIRQFYGKLLKCTGERREESESRSQLAEYVEIERLNRHTGGRPRRVLGWRPMLDFTTSDIWAMVKATGVPRHECYDMGADRLGCAGCIFSGTNDIIPEMRCNPDIFEKLDKLETDTGHTSSMTGERVRDRVKM